MRNFLHNLLGGLNLATLRQVRTAGFHISLAQAVALIILDLLLAIGTDYFRVGAPAQFNLWGLSSYSLSLTLLLFACVVAAWMYRMPYLVLELLVVTASAMPIIYAATLLLDGVYAQVPPGLPQRLIYYSYYVLVAWQALIFFRSLKLLTARLPRLLPVFMVFCAIAVLPLYYLPHTDFWLADRDETSTSAPRKWVNAEQVFYRQPDLIAKMKAKLLPERPGISDLYFVGMGSYALQDVFMKEVQYIRRQFDERFDTRDRSIALINNEKTARDTPLASSSNLSLVLDHLGSIMRTDDDILFLFITSHGSEKHELSTDFWPLMLNPITPRDLSERLDRAGIKWRIIVISACYSGGFIEPLQNDYSLIITAARADKTSFGCSNENDFTYFGEAYFKDQLSKQFSFIEAFRQASQAIAEREKKEGIEASYPQMYVGAQMQIKLKELETRLGKL
ncbi:MAG: C13 family peptidase [Gammaproteobacteria bacterium]|nr:C13 family peptidase [Gammaproteobacteria bacterium]